VNPSFHAGLLAGIGVANVLIHHFLWNKPWLESLGVGVLAAVIATVLAALLGAFR